MNILYHHRTQARLAEGVHIREIVKTLRALQNVVYVVSPPGIDIFFGEKHSDKKKTLKSGPWRWISRNVPEFIFEGMEICYNLVALFTIGKTLAHGMDLIYERYAFFCFSGALLANKRKIPYIVEVNEVSGVKRTRGQILVGIAKRIEKYIFGKADAIVVVSGFLKTHIASMGIEDSKIHLIPNGVNTETFNPGVSVDEILKKGLNLENKTVVGFTGSFVKWHNFEFLLRTFKEVTEEIKEDVVLLLVGDGPMRPEIERLAGEYNLTGKIYFTGNVGHAMIPAYLKMMHVCVIPHTNEFRSPIKLFEYMAMGKPVVAPAVAPVETVILHKVNGVLFKPDDKNSLKINLIDLLNDKTNRETIGRNALQTILDEYLWKYNAENIIEIYNAIKARQDIV